MHTTFFEYACLAILSLGGVMVVYGLVWLHGIPHHIAEKNNHPHKRSIHVACWLSLFTLHALWPLIYLWAMSPRTRLPVVIEHSREDEFAQRIAELEKRLTASAASAAPAAATDVPAAQV